MTQKDDARALVHLALIEIHVVKQLQDAGIKMDDLATKRLIILTVRATLVAIQDLDRKQPSDMDSTQTVPTKKS